MIEFEYPWVLAFIPVVLLGFFLTRRWGGARAVTRPKIRRMFGTEGERPTRVGSGLIGVVGLCFLLAALARPQWGQIEIKTFENARQVIIGLDLSRSMLAGDVTPSRLDRARLLIGTLLRELRGERVGLVVFAGTAFVQMPLTSDYEIMRELLRELNPNFLPEQGTNFNALLSTAYSAFDPRSTADKFLIVLSDGEDVVGNWRPEMEKLKNAGVRIITLGLATPEGALLPDGEGGFIKDQTGAVVLSRLDETVLRELAETTGGLYQPATAWVDLRDLIDRTIAQGRTGTFEENRRVTKIERFQIPLAAAMLFFLVSLWADFPVQPSRRGHKALHPEKARTGSSVKGRVPEAVTLILLFASVPVLAQPTTPPAPLPDLPGLVGELASQPKLTAWDCARLAEMTIDYGEAVLGSGKKLPPGIVRDGLAAVNLGEVRDPKAADWPELRRRLEDLLKESEQQKQDDPQKEDSPDQKKENEKDQSQPKQDGESQPHEDSSGEKGDQDSSGKTNPSSDDPKQGKSGQEPQDPSEGGGSPPENQEGKSDPGQNQPGRDRDKQEKETPPPEPGTGAENVPKPDPGETQEIGGGSTAANQTERHDVPPELQAVIGRLDQLRENDAPGRIHQLFAPEQRPTDTKGKTW